MGLTRVKQSPIQQPCLQEGRYRPQQAVWRSYSSTVRFLAWGRTASAYGAESRMADAGREIAPESSPPRSSSVSSPLSRTVSDTTPPEGASDGTLTPSHSPGIQDPALVPQPTPRHCRRQERPDPRQRRRLEAARRFGAPEEDPLPPRSPPLLGPPRPRPAHQDDRQTRPDCRCVQEEGWLRGYVVAAARQDGSLAAWGCIVSYGWSGVLKAEFIVLAPPRPLKHVDGPGTLAST